MNKIILFVIISLLIIMVPMLAYNKLGEISGLCFGLALVTACLYGFEESQGKTKRLSK